MPVLTAIIPTRDRSDILRDCLATLVNQDLSSGALEILVVDDGSETDLSDVVGTFAGSKAQLRYERQEPAGLNVARNRGSEVAAGELLAYLDDDTLVSPGWAAAIVEAFDTDACDALSGRIDLELEGDEPRWLSPKLKVYLGELNLGDRPSSLTESLFRGGNSALLRRTFDRVGGYVPGLDRSGDSLLSNGDVEFAGRLLRSGARLVYWPAAHLRHRVAAGRLSPQWFRRRAFAQGVSDGIVYPPSSDASKLGVFGREAIRMGRAAPILVRGVTQGRGSVAAGVWIAYCAGRISALRNSGKLKAEVG